MFEIEFLLELGMESIVEMDTDGRLDVFLDSNIRLI